MTRGRAVTLALVLILLVVAGLALLAARLAERPILTEAAIGGMVGHLGMAGPLALVGLMVLAIVVSPIPSGPIAVAAGALYGTLWGGTLTLAGALLGAFAAFGASRYLGFDAVRRSDHPVMRWIARPRSQGGLMLVVFASRLVPFISFDAVSYAAGLTDLRFGRFALATCLGCAPISFALAAAGSGMQAGGVDWMGIVTLAGAITLVPILARWLWLWRRGG